MKNGISRRAFLGAGAAFGAFNLVPGSVMGANAPSNRIVMGMIGVGGMGNGNMGTFLGMNDVQVVAVCDVNSNKTASAKNKVASATATRTAANTTTSASSAFATTSTP